ncbi:MAG: protein-L-isoaspartate O-methyltransferase, partial [Pseudomonadota bacterium]
LGYSSALTARLADAVIALENDGDRVSDAERALAEAGIDNVAVVEGPLTDGAQQHGPYDVILVQGAVQTMPDKITDQLKEGGRIVVIFQDGALGAVRVGYNIDGAVSWRFAFNAGAPVIRGFEADQVFVL